MRTKDLCIAMANETGDDSLLGGGGGPVAEEPVDDGPLVTAADVAARTTLDIKTIDRLVAARRFPKPVQLSERRRAWRLNDVLGWLRNLDAWDADPF